MFQVSCHPVPCYVPLATSIALLMSELAASLDLQTCRRICHPVTFRPSPVCKHANGYQNAHWVWRSELAVISCFVSVSMLPNANILHQTKVCLLDQQ